MDFNTKQFYQSLLSADEFTQLQQATQRPLVPAIRINTLKTTVERAHAIWPARYHWKIETVPFCPSGWRIVEGGDDLARTPEHKLGFYYIQEAASMLPAELFSLGENLLTLDMAAAPGGKSTHLVSRFGDRGLLVANDSSSSRIAPLRANLQDWGAANVAVSNSLGELWGNWFPESFDRVLLDAPCSGQSLRTAERRKSRPISNKEREALQAQQIRLITSGFQALKPGGELVYATCTLHPAEDEAVLDALLQRFPTMAEIASVDKVSAPALPEHDEQQFHPAVGRALRLWPHLYDTAGFFAALVRKTDSTPVQPQSPNGRTLQDRGYSPIKDDKLHELDQQLSDDFGFDLPAVLEAHELLLYQQGAYIFAIPQPYLLHFAAAPALSVGMMLAERKGPDLIPSHELMSRFGHTFTAGRITISQVEGERWLQGRELRQHAAPKTFYGKVVLVEDEWGRMLGRGKVLPNRLRNLLPRRLLY